MTADQQNLREETILKKRAKAADAGMTAAFMVGIVLGGIATLALIYTKWF